MFLTLHVREECGRLPKKQVLPDGWKKMSSYEYELYYDELQETLFAQYRNLSICLGKTLCNYTITGNSPIYSLQLWDHETGVSVLFSGKQIQQIGKHSKWNRLPKKISYERYRRTDGLVCEEDIQALVRNGWINDPGKGLIFKGDGAYKAWKLALPHRDYYEVEEGMIAVCGTCGYGRVHEMSDFDVFEGAGLDEG